MARAAPAATGEIPLIMPVVVELVGGATWPLSLSLSLLLLGIGGVRSPPATWAPLSLSLSLSLACLLRVKVRSSWTRTQGAPPSLWLKREKALGSRGLVFSLVVGTSAFLSLSLSLSWAWGLVKVPGLQSPLIP